MRGTVSRMGGVSVYQSALWKNRYPWLVHGVTLGRDPAGVEFDLGLGGSAPVGEALARWRTLRADLDFHEVVVSKQVHGSTIRVARGPGGGIHLGPPGDGHLTRAPDVLLAVGIADCVPVFMVEPETPVLGLLHAGWRGVADGIVEKGVDAMYDRFGVSPHQVEVYLGPAISREQYPVGEEVFQALGRAAPEEDRRLDLRGEIAGRLEGRGVPGEQVLVSQLCVGQDPRFFSHRGGDKGRQVAFIGYRSRGWP